jgi:hypothetical protein
MPIAPASRPVRTGLIAAVALSVGLAAQADAFVVYPFTSGAETLYLKWGDNHAGTIGGIVYWSFIPAGTAGSAYCGTACPGNSVSSINMEISPGGGFASVPLTSLEPQITAIYQRFGLNDRQIEIIARATPKRDYYCQSRRGNRLFELGLSEVAPAFAAASSKSDQAAITELSKDRNSFAAAWLRRKGLDWAADMLTTNQDTNP